MSERASSGPSGRPQGRGPGGGCALIGAIEPAPGGQKRRSNPVRPSPSRFFPETFPGVGRSALVSALDRMEQLLVSEQARALAAEFEVLKAERANRPRFSPKTIAG